MCDLFSGHAHFTCTVSTSAMTVLFSPYLITVFVILSLSLSWPQRGVSGLDRNLCIDSSSFTVRLLLWNITPILPYYPQCKQEDHVLPAPITSSLNPAQSPINPLFENHNPRTQIESSNHTVSQSLELVILRK